MPTIVDVPTIPLIAGAANKWNAVVSDRENIRNFAKPFKVETARGLLRKIIGEVEIREESDGVFAYTKLNAVGVYKGGAENSAS